MAGIGKRARKPAHQRYKAENRRLAHKRVRVLRSSKGCWTYETLTAHQQQRHAEWLAGQAEPVSGASGDRGNQAEFKKRERQRWALVEHVRRDLQRMRQMIATMQTQPKKIRPRSAAGLKRHVRAA